MKNRRLAAGLCAAAVLVPIGAGGGTAAAAEKPTRVVATGFYDAADLDYAYGRLYLAEPRLNRVSSVTPDGRRRVELSGVAGVQTAERSFGRLYAASSPAGWRYGPWDDDEVHPEPAGSQASWVMAAPVGRPATLLTDLRAWNPNSFPADLLGPRRAGGALLVADAGVGAVLRVDPVTGAVTSFFKPRPTGAGSDRRARPVALAWGPGGLYVAVAQEASSILTSQNRGSVVVLDPDSGAVRSTVAGLYDPTGLAVADDGTVFVSQEWYPVGGTQVDPSQTDPPCSCGQIIRIDPDGTRRYTQAVRQPRGLATVGGRLFATRDSTSPDYFSPSPWADLVEVSPSAFVPGRAVVRPR